MSEIKVSILTPTFNRKNKLKDLYDSLCNQSNMLFEWIVVDDGSTDDTKQFFDSLNENRFRIQYVYKKNGGKHSAVNYGMNNVSSEFVYILDSDDTLVEDAVEAIYSWIPMADDELCAGISGLRGLSEKVVLGQFPKNKYFVKAKNNLRHSKKLLGDKAEIYKTKILLKYPFPIYEGENYLQEEAVWNKIALDGYYLVWFNKIIQICNYQDDGLTKNLNNEMLLKNFKGFEFTKILNFRAYKFPYNYVSLLDYIRIAKLKGLSIKSIFDNNDICYIHYIPLTFIKFLKYIKGRLD